MSSKARKIHLTLTSDYARSWGTWEGVREIVTNWHDGIYAAYEMQDLPPCIDDPVAFHMAQDDTENLVFESYITNSSDKKSLGTLHFDKNCNRLSLVNRETELHKKVLLMGYSDKPGNRREMIGQFGEGLKVGALALLRKNLSVFLETSKEIWRFDLVHDDQFGQDVLTVFVTDRYSMDSDPEHTYPPCPVSLKANDTCTTVCELEYEKWMNYKKRFLFLEPPTDCTKTDLGTLLFDKQYKGQIYVKGVWVAKDDDLSVGVDFIQLQIDRDRNAVPKPSETDHFVSCMWVKAVEIKPDLSKLYYQLLKNESKFRDVKHAVSYASEHVAQLVAQQFVLEHGTAAFAASYSAEDKDLEYIKKELHKQVVKCNQILLDILHKSGQQKPLAEEVSEHRGMTQVRISPFRLSDDEKNVLDHAIEMLKLADPEFNPAVIDVIRYDEGELESCSTHEDRIDLPSWYFDLTVIHKIGRLCNESELQVDCKCREVHLCNALLQIRDRHVKYPDRNYEGLSGRLPRNSEHPLMFVINKMILESCENSPITPHCAPIHEAGKLVDAAAFHAGCCEKEEELHRDISDCEVKFQELASKHSREVQEMKAKLKVAQNELMRTEIKTVDNEGNNKKIREHYEKQMTEAQTKAVEMVQDIQAHMKESREQLIHIQRERNHLNTQVERYEHEKEEKEDAHKRRKAILMEETWHYVQQLRERTVSLVEELKKRRDKCTGEEREEIEGLLGICQLIKDDIKHESKFVCSVCKKNRKECVFTPCGHYISCEECYKQSCKQNDDSEQTKENKCPTCKNAIKEVIYPLHQ